MILSLRLTILAAGMLALLLAAAGRIDVWRFWGWVGVMWLAGVLTYARLAKVSPALVAERMKPPTDRDRATRRLVALPFLALLVTSGLDARWEWSRVPLAVQLAGLALVALGFALVSWVLFTNPFASSAVRIQDDRGQRVISGGPYAFVRHPMYSAVLLVCMGSGPALGSWPGGLALVPVVAIFVRRTRIEDGMLARDLDGYPAYAARVRWRLIPFVF
jgi:protein-S-isoprenylcysteine O-methyltransferase Ste14